LLLFHNRKLPRFVSFEDVLVGYRFRAYFSNVVSRKEVFSKDLVWIRLDMLPALFLI